MQIGNILLMPSTYQYDETIRNLQAAVDGSFSDLQSQINNMNQKTISSPSELQTQVTSFCDTFKESMGEAIDETKLMLVAEIPKDPTEASSRRDKILPRIVEIFKALGRYVKSMISKVIKFFVGLWDSIKNRIVWCAQKVASFFADLKQGFIEVFGKSNVLVGY